MKYKVIVGIEFETEYNTKMLGELSQNGHHSESGWCKFLDNKYFKCEEDRSLRVRKFGDTVEIISAPIELSNVQTVLKSLQKSIYKKVGKSVPFNKVFSVNNTCGCHIHISILNCDNKFRYEIYDDGREEIFDFAGKPYNIREILSDDFMTIFRKKLHKNISKNLGNIYPSFSKNYFRYYAQNRKNNVKDNARYVEYYYATKERCEFRSFNLIGVKTWNEFFKIFELFENSLQSTLNDYKKRPKLITTHVARIKCAI